MLTRRTGSAAASNRDRSLLAGAGRSSKLKVIAIAVIVCLLALLSVSYQAHAAGTMHRTYWFSVRYLSGPIRHPGDPLKLQWTAHQGALSAEAKPTPVVLTVQIVGAYASVNALKKDYPRYAPTSINGSGFRRTTDWNGRTFTSSLKIPRTARRGFYDLVTRVSEPGHSGVGAWIFEVR